VLDAEKDVVRRAWAAYDAGDESGFAACMTPEWREHDR
jgi:ketosteroid isomerase-like protein